MPDKMQTVAIGAAAVRTNILDDWKYRKLPYPALVTLLISSDEAAVPFHVMTGTTEVVELGSELTKGTIDVIPVPNTTPVIQFTAPKDDEVFVYVSDNATGNGHNCMYWINVERAA